MHKLQFVVDPNLAVGRSVSIVRGEQKIGETLRRRAAATSERWRRLRRRRRRRVDTLATARLVAVFVVVIVSRLKAIDTIRKHAILIIVFRPTCAASKATTSKITTHAKTRIATVISGCRRRADDEPHDTNCLRTKTAPPTFLPHAVSSAQTRRAAKIRFVTTTRGGGGERFESPLPKVN